MFKTETNRKLMLPEHKRLAEGKYRGAKNSSIRGTKGDSWSKKKRKGKKAPKPDPQEEQMEQMLGQQQKSKGKKRKHTLTAGANKKAMAKGKRRKGGKTLNFKPGGLHRTTGTPKGQKIPKSKLRAALAGKDGPKGKKQAEMAKNVFHVSAKKKGKKGKRRSY